MEYWWQDFSPSFWYVFEKSPVWGNTKYWYHFEFVEPLEGYVEDEN
jgi:hypothetical protein